MGGIGASSGSTLLSSHIKKKKYGEEPLFLPGSLSLIKIQPEVHAYLWLNY